MPLLAGEAASEPLVAGIHVTLSFREAPSVGMLTFRLVGQGLASIC